MRLIVAAVGRLKDGPERKLYDRYAERIGAVGRAVGLGPLETRETPESRAAAVETRLAEEAARLLAKCRDADLRVALDARGKGLTSQAFALEIRDWRDRGADRCTFLIGGPDGHGAAALEGADLVLSLGPLTLPHGLARIVLAEQLYRAATILSGHPYHRG